MVFNADQLIEINARIDIGKIMKFRDVLDGIAGWTFVNFTHAPRIDGICLFVKVFLLIVLEPVGIPPVSSFKKRRGPSTAVGSAVSTVHVYDFNAWL